MQSLFFTPIHTANKNFKYHVQTRKERLWVAADNSFHALLMFYSVPPFFLNLKCIDLNQKKNPCHVSLISCACMTSKCFIVKETFQKCYF